MSSQETTRALIDAAREQARTNREVIGTNREVVLALDRVSASIASMQRDGRMSDTGVTIFDSNQEERLRIVEGAVIRQEARMEAIEKQTALIPDMKTQLIALSGASNTNTKGHDRITSIVVGVITAAIIAIVMSLFGG